MQPPKFWHKPAGRRAKLLSPLAALYARNTRKKLEEGELVKLDIPTR